MLIVITILGTIAIAIAGAFAIEFFNTTLRNETDVEEQMGLPVLATVQYYRS
jgi:capsular polysaccharide biosynthesis protein